MFNSINSYKSLFLFLKTDFAGHENFNFTPKSITNPVDNPTLKQNIDKNLLPPQNPNNTPEHKELTRNGVNSIGYELEQLGVGKIFYQNRAFSDALSTFFIQNNIDNKPGDTLKLDLKDGKYILSGKSSGKDWFYDITLAIPEDRKALDAKFVAGKKTINKACEDGLAECRADNDKLEKNDTGGGYIDFSKLSQKTINKITNTENVKIAYNFLIDKGFPKVAIAGLLANMARECSFNPNPGGSHIGIFQWSKVRANRIDNAIGTNIAGKNSPIEDQLRGFYWEVTEGAGGGTCPGTFEGLMSATSPSDAARTMLNKFERSKSRGPDDIKNTAFADDFYQAMA